MLDYEIKRKAEAYTIDERYGSTKRVRVTLFLEPELLAQIDLLIKKGGFVGRSTFFKQLFEELVNDGKIRRKEEDRPELEPEA